MRGNLLDVEVGTYQHAAGIGADEFRDEESHGVAGRLLDYSLEVGGRDIQLVGIEADVVVLPVMGCQQFAELAEYLARAFYVDRHVAVALAESIGRLQQQQAAQVADDAVGVDFETPQVAREEVEGLPQIATFLGFQRHDGEVVDLDELGQLAVQQLAAGQAVEVFGHEADAGKGEVGACMVQGGCQAGREYNQIFALNRVVLVHVGEQSCSTFDENEKEAFADGCPVVG